MGKDAEESIKGRLAWNSLDTERLGHGGVGGGPSHPGELVRTAEDAAEESEGGIGGDEGVRAGGAMGLEVGKDLTETMMLGEVRPDDHAAVGRETLVREADPEARRTTRSGNLHPHRLVRLLSRRL